MQIILSWCIYDKAHDVYELTARTLKPSVTM